MLRVMYTCVAVLSIAAVSLPAQNAGGSPPGKPANAARRRAAKPAPKVQEPPPPPTAIAPMTPEQLPAGAPRVSYHNGVLTVDSENSTLGAVLNAIRRQTGAQIDAPPTGSNQRVAVHLSGTPRVVIASLLDGSDLGYAIVAAPEDPERVQQVILMTQSKGAGQSAAYANPAQHPGPPPSQSYPEPGTVDENPTPEQMNERYSRDAQPEPGQVSPDMPGEQPPEGMPDRPPQMPPAQPPQSQNSGQPQARTPEQLLQELQRMRNGRNTNQ